MDFLGFNNPGEPVAPGDVKSVSPKNAEPINGVPLLFEAGKISAIEIVDANTIKVTFSKAVDFSTVSDPSGWVIEGEVGHVPQVHEVLNSTAVTYYKYIVGPNSTFYSTNGSLAWTKVETIVCATVVALNLYPTLVKGETYEVSAKSAAHWNGIGLQS